MCFDNKLTYPVDSEYLLRKKKKIKRELLKKEDFIEKKIAVLGGSTTSEIINILELFLLFNGIKPSFYESGFNLFYEDALFANEKLDKFNPDIVYIHVTHKNIYHSTELIKDKYDVDNAISNEIYKYSSIWKSLDKYNCDIIQNNFDFPLHRNLGNLDCYDISGKTYFLNKLNQKIAEKAIKINNLHINDINYLSSYIGIHNWFDNILWHKAKYAVSMESIPELSFNISKIINAIIGKNKKCLVLDLDNTCWGGVIGDDGLSGIEVGLETATSEAFTYFQNYIRELKNRGIILAVCSKNNFNNAKEGFSHPDTVLKFQDFSSFKANFDHKHYNIINIGNDINIGLDSLVFIDDNPVERELVSLQLPTVVVPNVGSDVTNFISHIDRNGYFESVSLSSEDLNRHMYYEDNKKRINEEISFKSYDGFLQSLKMVADIGIFSKIYIDRITQLINKTNQFNLTTKRYSLGETKMFMNSGKYISLYLKLSDKHGSSGLVSIIVGRIKGNECHVDLFLMSCRVLKRGVEFIIFDEYIKYCKKHNMNRVIGYYFKSAKNSIVSTLYKDLGFLMVNDDSKEKLVWILDVSKYVNKGKFIEVVL